MSSKPPVPSDHEQITESVFFFFEIEKNSITFFCGAKD